MRAVLVVVDQPSVGNRLNLSEVGEQVCIEHLGARSAIEALDESVLIWILPAGVYLDAGFTG